MNITSDFVRTTEGRLFFRSTGRGDPVVLLHGGSGRGEWFDTLLPLLPASLKLIVVDLPGHGRSPRLAQYDLETMTSIKGEFIESVCERPAVLFGHSFGGHLALSLASRLPKLCRAVILGDVPLKLERLKDHTVRNATMLVAWRSLSASGKAAEELLDAI